MTIEKASIYVDIDALFDSRMATLRTFGFDTIEKAITGGYYERVFDEFEGVDTTAYKEAYDKRSLATLYNAMITPVGRLIQKFVKDTVMAAVGTPFIRTPKIVLNAYPYQLTDEYARWIIAGLRAITDSSVEIEVIQVPLEEITPDHVKSNYVMMAMYAYWEWLEIHSLNQKLVDSRCQSVTLYGPRLVKSKEAAAQLVGQDPFTAIETYTGLFIKLMLLDASVFSVDLGRLRKLKLDN